MSGPFEGRNPFEGFPMFADLARLFSAQGPVNWDVARQIAGWVATQGTPEGNVEPLERIRMEELARVADLHVSDATGLSTSVAGGVLSVLPVTRGDWALHSLEAYRPLLEQLAAALTRSRGEGVEPDPATQLLGDLTKVLGPVLLGLQSGFMVGHLAGHSFGQYDLPVPRRPADQVLLVPANIDAFATEWSLPADDLRMWVCLHEIAHHAVLGRTHVRARLLRLIEEYVGGFQVDPDAVENSLGELDPSDPSRLQEILGNPETLLGVIQTPAQQEVRQRIETLLTAVEGYVDHVLETLGHGLVGSYPKVVEAVRRRRADASEGERFAARLLGLELGRAQFERGAAFARGVVERAGEDGLRRLWAGERELPTAAELDAPGLWLARIDLPD
jgi:putative hydrolase